MFDKNKLDNTLITVGYLFIGCLIVSVFIPDFFELISKNKIYVFLLIIFFYLGEIFRSRK